MLGRPKKNGFAKVLPADSGKAVEDYARIKTVIEFLSENWRQQPQLEEIAKAAGLSPFHCQKLFRRWAGVTPKEFLQAITLDHARDMLRASSSILETAYEVGLSGPGRLHDLFVGHEAVTPGDFKRGGDGLEIAYGRHSSPFGIAIAMATPRGLSSLAFADDEAGSHAVLQEMMTRFPQAVYREASDITGPYVRMLFSRSPGHGQDALKIILIGTDFEIRVWEKLLKVPMGQVVSYGELAGQVCTPAAARAVGSAVGRNPLAFVVPCHRVLRADGNIGGYHWGVTRKKAIIGWEMSRTLATSPAEKFNPGSTGTKNTKTNL